MRVTLKDIGDLCGTCSSHVDTFKFLFGDYADVTVENVLKALRYGLPVSYWMGTVLSEDRMSAFDSKEDIPWRDYNEKKDDILNKYHSELALLICQFITENEGES